MLNAEGLSYEVFDETDYQVVGIYEDFQATWDSRRLSSLAPNTVVIPWKAVNGEPELSIAADGPMKHYNTSFQIPNGSIEEYSRNWSLQGIDNLEIIFNDMNYGEINSNLNAEKKAAIILLLIGVLAMLSITVFFVYMSIYSQRRSISIERSLGVTKSKCANALLSGILIIAATGVFCGILLGRFAALNGIRDLILDFNRSLQFDTSFSNWIRETGQNVLDSQSGNGLLMLALVDLLAMLFIAGFTMFAIRTVLKEEPLTLLGN